MCAVEDSNYGYLLSSTAHITVSAMRKNSHPTVAQEVRLDTCKYHRTRTTSRAILDNTRGEILPQPPGIRVVSDHSCLRLY